MKFKKLSTSTLSLFWQKIKFGSNLLLMGHWCKEWCSSFSHTLCLWASLAVGLGNCHPASHSRNCINQCSLSVQKSTSYQCSCRRLSVRVSLLHWHSSQALKPLWSLGSNSVCSWAKGARLRIRAWLCVALFWQIYWFRQVLPNTSGLLQKRTEQDCQCQGSILTMAQLLVFLRNMFSFSVRCGLMHLNRSISPAQFIPSFTALCHWISFSIVQK